MKKILIPTIIVIILIIAGGIAWLHFPREPLAPVETGASGGGDTFSPAGMEELRALGYVGGTHENTALRQEAGVYTPNAAEKITPVLFETSAKPVTNLLANRNDLERVEITGETRMALNLLPGSAVSFQGVVPPNARMLFGAGQAYAQIKPNSLILQLDVFDSESKLLQQEIVSTIAGQWSDRSIDLDRYSGQTLRFVFSVLSFDPTQDRNPISIGPLLVTHPTNDRSKCPHVFFVLIDTLRADALSCYGQKDPITPNLDRLAKEGVLAENVIVQSPHTETSIPTILLGVYPHIHGRMMRDSKHNSADPVYLKTNALSNDYTAIAEVFQEAGYLTYGLYNNILISADFGFHRGFYTYIDYAAESGLSDPWGRIAFPTANMGMKAAIDLIQRAPEGVPLFVFLHILDPHNPFTPPDNYNLSVKRPAKNIDEAAYLGEVAYVDEQIGKLVSTLKQSKLYQDSILVITSDHGEEFVNPYGRPIGHGRTMFQTLLHVPFICVYPGLDRPGLRIETMVESIDVFPTILELAGLSYEGEISGESFVPLIKPSERIYNKQEAIAEAIRKGEERKCLIKNGFKLVYFRDSDRSFLYDLQYDPNELEDIAAKNPDLVSEMKNHILERFQIEKPDIQPLEIVNHGQDGWDLVHTFTRGSSQWQPGIADVHLSVKPFPEGIERVDIWADDHLHGNRNYSFGWRWPSLGENPIAVESNNDSLDMYFEALESLESSIVFVRLVDRENKIYLGSFQGGAINSAPQKTRTKYPVLIHWDFEQDDQFDRWRTGQGGTLSRVTKGSGTNQNTVMQFESNARSGAFRVYHLIPKVPPKQRLVASFELVVEAGGVKIELVHPRSAQTIASHTFSIDEAGTHSTKIEPRTLTICGVTGVSAEEEELLFLISNFSPQHKPARVLFNDITVYAYPAELETDTHTTSIDRMVDRDM